MQDSIYCVPWPSKLSLLSLVSLVVKEGGEGWLSCVLVGFSLSLMSYCFCGGWQCQGVCRHWAHWGGVRRGPAWQARLWVLAWGGISSCVRSHLSHPECWLHLTVTAEPSAVHVLLLRSVLAPSTGCPHACLGAQCYVLTADVLPSETCSLHSPFRGKISFPTRTLFVVRFTETREILKSNMCV